MRVNVLFPFIFFRILWVWCSFFSFLYASLVPRLYSSVPTHAAYGARLVLVAISTIQALPSRFSTILFLGGFSLAIVTAFRAMVALHIRLHMRGVVMGMFRSNGRNVGVVLRV